MAKNDKAPDEGAAQTSAPEPAAKPADTGKRTPDAWAKLRGRTRPVRVTEQVGRSVRSTIVQRPDPIHAAAATLHGWEAHAYHANAPIELSGEDYDAAIQAVLDHGKPETVEINGPDGKSVKVERPQPLRPHVPALSPHAPYRAIATRNARSES